MGMFETVFRHKGIGHYSIGNQILPEVEQSLGEFIRALAAVLIPVTRPDKFAQCRSTRPELIRDVDIINLLRPERGLGADDVLRLRLGKVGCEIVVIDALPGLVWRTP